MIDHHNMPVADYMCAFDEDLVDVGLTPLQNQITDIADLCYKSGFLPLPEVINEHETGPARTKSGTILKYWVRTETTYQSNVYVPSCPEAEPLFAYSVRDARNESDHSPIIVTRGDETVAVAKSVGSRSVLSFANDFSTGLRELAICYIEPLYQGISRLPRMVGAYTIDLCQLQGAEVQVVRPSILMVPPEIRRQYEDWCGYYTVCGWHGGIRDIIPIDIDATEIREGCDELISSGDVTELEVGRSGLLKTRKLNPFRRFFA